MSHNNKHSRKSLRLPFYDYSSNGYYFITTCIHEREQLLGNIHHGIMHLNEYGKIVEKYWHELSYHYPNIELDEFIIMPDHFHGIIIIHELDLSKTTSETSEKNSLPRITKRRQMLIPKIVGRFKMNASKEINEFRKSAGVKVWQKNYYDHIIRNDVSLNNIREYILNNPSNWKQDDGGHPKNL